MITGFSFEEFASIFGENLEKRSRTAKGISDTSSSSKKKKLLKVGEELKAQVKENTDRLIRAIWVNGCFFATTKEVPSNDEIKFLMERWDFIINQNLQDPDAYAEDYGRLSKEAVIQKDATGLNYRINKQYRTWSVTYTKLNLSPLELEFAMDKFYTEFSSKIALAKEKKISQANLLAYADLVIDGEIHPWADGCGRNATASVMWLSLLSSDFKLPVFGTREEHYANIHDLTEHTKYFEKCLTG